MQDYDEIINFWFDEVGPQAWFTKDESLDKKIKEFFGELHGKATRGELREWRKTALGRLAEIIILDQFSRNMFRDSAEAFAYDEMALELAREAMANSAKTELNAQQRWCLYLPFMHSESKQVHEEAVELFSEPGLEHVLEWEIKHKEIIDKFGRYPHRNEILGRESTTEEAEFLQQAGSSF